MVTKKKTGSIEIQWFDENISEKNMAKNVMLAILHTMDGNPHPEAEKFFENMKIKHVAAFMDARDDFFLGTPKPYDCWWYDQLAQLLLAKAGLDIQIKEHN